MNKFSAKYNLKGKTSIVLGGLGLIGWSITESLINSDAKVIILDNDKKKWDIKKKQINSKKLNIRYIYFDASDIKNIEKNFNLKNIDEIFKIIIQCAVFEFMYKPNLSRKIIIKEYLNVSNFFLNSSQTKYLNAILDSLAKSSSK